MDNSEASNNKPKRLKGHRPLTLYFRGNRGEWLGELNFKSYWIVGPVFLSGLILFGLFLVLLLLVELANGVHSLSGWTFIRLNLGLLFFGVGVAAVLDFQTQWKKLVEWKALQKNTEGFNCLNQRWFYDYHWNSRIARDLIGENVGNGRIIGWILIGLFAPYHIWSLLIKGGLPIGILFVDALMAYVVVKCFRNFNEYKKFKKGVLKFNSMPFYSGESLHLTFSAIDKNTESLMMKLRYIREDIVGISPFPHLISPLGCFELFCETRQWSKQELAGKDSLEIEWPLMDKPEWLNGINKRPPQYWELDVMQAFSDGESVSRYLLPVYSRTPQGSPEPPFPESMLFPPPRGPVNPQD